MITSRYIQESDYPALEESLAKDMYHNTTKLDFFLEEGTVTSLYSFDDEPICFVRGRPLWSEGIAIIQLDIQFLNNENRAKNLVTMITGFYELEKKAKEHKFSGFIFMSDVPLLRKFCIRRLGFEEWEGDFLVKVFQQVPVDAGLEVVV